MDTEARSKLSRLALPGGVFVLLAIAANWGWAPRPLGPSDVDVDKFLTPSAPAPRAVQNAPADSSSVISKDGMQRIPAGVSVEAFWIDATETTVESYDACITANVCKAEHLGGHLCNWGRPGKKAHPINCVDWHQATAYCEWAGKRLPTAAEWEYSARGTESRTYPWGETAPATREALDALGCWTRDGTCPVGAHPEGRTPFGLLDMAGNVYEWTASDMRGGSWNGGDDLAALRTSLAAKIAVGNVGPQESFDNELGFRCARSIDAAP